MGWSQRSRPSPASSPAGDVEEAIRASERRTLAVELHDTVMQPLTALITSLECAQLRPHMPEGYEAHIGTWQALVREAIDGLRGTLAGLSEHSHAELGLPEALRSYLAPQLRSRGVRVTVDVGDWPDDLPLDITTSLYLALREALTNVEKHARASLVSVVLRATDRTLHVTIADDGIGITEQSPARRARSTGSGLGIEGMRARARALGGRLTLATAPGQGVRLALRIPYRRQVSAGWAR